MAENERYNGWANYETWNVALWAGNEERYYDLIRANSPYTPEKALRIALGIWPDGTADMESAESFDKVNWADIAKAWNEL